MNDVILSSCERKRENMGDHQRQVQAKSTTNALRIKEGLRSVKEIHFFIQFLRRKKKGQNQWAMKINEGQQRGLIKKRATVFFWSNNQKICHFWSAPKKLGVVPYFFLRHSKLVFSSMLLLSTF
jgi:hypothetical protein